MPAPKENQYAAGNEGGRPTKYEKKFAQQAYEYCLLGATNEKLAENFGVSLSTLKDWMERRKEFSAAVIAGKTSADAKVAKALYRRATGYKYKETTFEKVADQQTLEHTADEAIIQEVYKKKVVVKHLAPDPGAAMNWLKNRQPALWKEGYDINLNKGEDIEIWTADDVLAFQHWKANQTPPASTDGH